MLPMPKPEIAAIAPATIPASVRSRVWFTIKSSMLALCADWCLRQRGFVRQRYRRFQSGVVLLPDEMLRHLITRAREFHEIVPKREFQPSFPHLPQDAGA
jgi:hypothetical protein